MRSLRQLRSATFSALSLLSRSISCIFMRLIQMEGHLWCMRVCTTRKRLPNSCFSMAVMSISLVTTRKMHFILQSKMEMLSWRQVFYNMGLILGPLMTVPTKNWLKNQVTNKCKSCLWMPKRLVLPWDSNWAVRKGESSGTKISRKSFLSAKSNFNDFFIFLFITNLIIFLLIAIFYFETYTKFFWKSRNMKKRSKYQDKIWVIK